MGAKVDLTNKRFGRLLVVGEAGQDKYRSYKWRCVCDCGNEVVVTRANLVSGHTKSCGCYSKEVSRWKNGIPHKKLTRVRLAMIKRCYDPKCKEYHYYGERGIKVCDEWIGENGREQFILWALLHGYSEGLTIERIDVNGDYEPGNCCWISAKEQAKNRTTTLFVEYNGKKMCAADAAKLSGIKAQTLRQRIRKGWAPEHLFDAPNAERQGG